MGKRKAHLGPVDLLSLSPPEVRKGTNSSAGRGKPWLNRTSYGMAALIPSPGSLHTMRLKVLCQQTASDKPPRKLGGQEDTSFEKPCPGPEMALVLSWQTPAGEMQHPLSGFYFPCSLPFSFLCLGPWELSAGLGFLARINA